MFSLKVSRNESAVELVGSPVAHGSLAAQVQDRCKSRPGNEGCIRATLERSRLKRTRLSMMDCTVLSAEMNSCVSVVL